MTPENAPIKNPFKPGAGHMPPFLAGREEEQQEFRRLLAQQDTILENMVLTGLRGVGKTVLLETLKPIAMQENWVWLGTDLSEAAALTESHLVTRLLADLSVSTSSIVTQTVEESQIGYGGNVETIYHTLDYTALLDLYKDAPGLASDKLKQCLLTAWDYIKQEKHRGIVFAYDEAQNLADHASRGEFPLSLLLDVFQAIQRQGIPLMLVLVGLPTLFPKLVEARTYSERMFRVVHLDRLNLDDTRDAITQPVADESCPMTFNDNSVDMIATESDGYPYFIQFICREVFDIWVQKYNAGQPLSSVPVQQIIRKLDDDFFAGRWARTTDRQRDLLRVIATLDNADGEFTCQDIVRQSKESSVKSFGASHVNQMLASLSDAGLVYKNRHGRYSFAVPLLGKFIVRQNKAAPDDSFSSP